MKKAIPFSILCICFLTTLCTLSIAESEQTAKEILDTTDVNGGLIVHIGCGDGRLTAALCANDSYMAHGLDTDAGNVEKSRGYIQSLGVYGSKVSVDQLKGKKLPYIDNLANLVVSEDLAGVPMKEVIRVLAPKGVAYIKNDGEWVKTVKPRPEEIDEWTHYMHDSTGNAVAHDSAIGPPRHMQWVGSPRWSRHHDRMASMSALVSTNGRIFYVFDEGPTASVELPPEWTLIARDAFNGVILWKRPISSWFPHMWPFKSGSAQLPRRLVAVGERVYTTLGFEDPLTALDAATGEIIRTYEGTRSTEEVIASDGVLFLLVNEAEAPTTRKKFKPIHRNVGEEKKRVAAEWPWDEEKRWITAVQADSGKILWKRDYPVIPLTLAADQESVYFHDGVKIVRLNRKNGEEVWISEPVSRRPSIPVNFGPTLVVYKDAILFSGGDRSMSGLSAETGKILWTADHPRSGHNSPEDLLVIDGLVWSGEIANTKNSGVFKGRDPYTGEVKIEFPPDIDTYWFHHRCYRSKATDNYILPSRTGIEFVDFREKHWTINHWVRGGCVYGIMPCNGMVYAPPHDCACYPETKLYGFNVLAPESKARRSPSRVSDRGRLERGPAYGEAIEDIATGDADWPTYRHDANRSGFTKAAVPADLKRSWEIKMGGKLSSLVIAGDRMFLAEVDKHTVHALDANSGKTLWSYTTGGRVDSPPTIYKGLVLFGSADGWVYSLRASDGALIWRFRAAPVDMRVMAFEQVESVWPVHGSVLVQNDQVYCVAGRSMFLDGGMRMLRIDVKTGKKLSESIMNDREPETGEDLQARIQILNMPVGLPDVLSSDGKYVYMRSQRFDMRGIRQEIGPHSGKPAEQGAVQTGEGVHLFCPYGFLDDTWFHRSYWVYGKSFAGGHGGYPQAGKFAPGGRILVFDDSSVYGFGREPEYYKWTTPLEYQLFAASKSPKVIRETDRRGRPTQRQQIEYNWANSVPLQAQAMVLADKTFFIAGPPDVVDEEEAFDRYDEAEIQAALKDQSDALKGKKGAMLWAISAADGKKLAEYKLDSLPVFDGMIAAKGRLYLTTKAGQVLCFAGNE